MKNKIVNLFSVMIAAIIITSCGAPEKEVKSDMQKKLDEYAEVELTSDISHLNDNQKEMLGYLFEAAQLMDDIFWQEAYGNKDELLNNISDPAAKKFVKINYGPWERLNDNKPFIEGFEKKPAGANFYPKDMTKEEFDALEAQDKTSLYTLIRKNENSKLYTIPYHEAFKEETTKALI